MSFANAPAALRTFLASLPKKGRVRRKGRPPSQGWTTRCYRDRVVRYRWDAGVLQVLDLWSRGGLCPERKAAAWEGLRCESIDCSVLPADEDEDEASDEDDKQFRLFCALRSNLAPALERAARCDTAALVLVSVTTGRELGWIWPCRSTVLVRISTCTALQPRCAPC